MSIAQQFDQAYQEYLAHNKHPLASIHSFIGILEYESETGTSDSLTEQFLDYVEERTESDPDWTDTYAS